jgi:hypothetical protein
MKLFKMTQGTKCGLPKTNHVIVDNLDATVNLGTQQVPDGAEVTSVRMVYKHDGEIITKLIELIDSEIILPESYAPNNVGMADTGNKTPYFPGKLTGNFQIPKPFKGDLALKASNNERGNNDLDQF